MKQANLAWVVAIVVLLILYKLATRDEATG